MDNLRVLVVDDEPGMRLGVERALRDFTVNIPHVDGTVGFETVLAESGEEGLAAIAERQPDLVLLDHKLPGISGLELLEQVQDRTADMLVIMITAYASIETAVVATKRGAYDFLPKPFTPAELKSVVKKAAARVVLAQQARRLADEKKRVRFEFIRVLGHELKAPIAAVEGYLDIVRDRALGDDLGKYDEIVGRSLIRLQGMRKLIMDLLDMTRIESGEKRRDLVELDLREVADGAVDGQRVLAAERRIEIVLEAPGKLPFRADRPEMDMVFNNLVSNAVKYNRDGGKVTVTVVPQDGGVTIVVADTGIGMTKEECDKLFGEFVRIKNSKTRNILGSGLGLSILKRITELYDGKISVTSQPDVGTTFTVVLHAPEPAAL